MLSALALALADCALPSLPRAARWRRGAEKHCPRGARHPTRPPKKTVTSPAMTPGCVSASAWLYCYLQNRNGLRPLLAHLRHHRSIRRSLLSGANRTTFAQTEFFAF